MSIERNLCYVDRPFCSGQQSAGGRIPSPWVRCFINICGTNAKKSTVPSARGKVEWRARELGAVWPEVGSVGWRGVVRTWAQDRHGPERGQDPQGDSQSRPAFLPSKRSGSSGWAVGLPPPDSLPPPRGSGGLPRLTRSQGEHKRCPFSWSTHLPGAGCSLAPPTLRPAQLLPRPEDPERPRPPRPAAAGLGGLRLLGAAPWDARPAWQKHGSP